MTLGLPYDAEVLKSSRNPINYILYQSGSCCSLFFTFCVVNLTNFNWMHATIFHQDFATPLVCGLDGLLVVQYNPEITVLKGPANFDLYWRELFLVVRNFYNFY